MQVATLWGQICSRLPLVKHAYSLTRLLTVLEILISSGLESKHKIIVSTTVTLWNSTFGTCEDNLEYPTRVADALLRLRPIADLDLPSFPHTLETEVSAEHRQPPTFPETQADEMDFVSSSILDLALPANMSNGSPRHRSFSLGPVKTIRSAASIRPRDQTPESSRKKSKKRVLTPKLRHNDSQIQFETIQSSPIADAVLDSQLLTDRQKEVKERQKAEAASMFPDIRSTPISKAGSVQRRLSSASSSGGLSLHRSASKLRLLSPSIVERQTTPEPPGDFDAFLHSSPTPTRSLQASVDVNGPPSSPPESPKSRVADSNISSSPPEQTSESMFDSTTTEQPAAQINPFDRTVSTFNFSASDKDFSMLNIPTGPRNLVHAQAVLDLPSSGTGTDTVESISLAIHQDEKVLSSNVPSTPERLENLPAVEKQTPKTLVFHDALESPLTSSSDKQTVDENFEDAVTSPKVQIEQNKSSPFSEFDQSGVMKLMAGYDLGSGRARNDSPTENDDEVIANGNLGLSVENRLKSFHNNAEVQTNGQFDAARRDVEALSKVPVSSSLASVIPETPGTRVPKDWIIAEDERYDPEDTIVVDVPDDIDEFPKSGRKRKFSLSPRKRYSVFVEIPSRKKLKLEDDHDNGNIVPDSQFTSIQGKLFYISIVLFNETDRVKESQSKKSTPTKKRKGRRRPNSVTPSQVAASQQSEMSDSFSFADESMDLDASMQSQEDQESVAGASRLNGNDLKTANGAGVDEEMKDMVVGRASGSPDVEVVDEPSPPIQPQREEILCAEDMEVVAETTRNSPMRGTDNISSVKAAENLENLVPETAPEAGTELSRHLVPTKVAHIDVSIQTERVVEAITSTSMAKTYLQSIFNFFSGAALTKEQAAAYEDQLDDAKEQLFGAKRRGRELS